MIVKLLKAFLVMRPQSCIGLTIIVAGVLMGGCASNNTLRVTYQSDPPGAEIFQAVPGGIQSSGYLPLTVEYGVDAKDHREGYIIGQDIEVRWVSGARVFLDNIKWPLNGGPKIYTFIRPKQFPGYEEDLKFALKLREIDASQRQQAQAEAHENAQLLIGVLQGINAGIQQSPTIKCRSFVSGSTIQTKCR